jgi:hypothetical protein
MKTNLVSERGQVLVLVALAIIGLVGITGLAIDGSTILADRRDAQNAADTASLAGALAYIRECQSTGCDDPGDTEVSNAEYLMKLAALDLALKNGYERDLLSSDIDINRPPVGGPYDGDNEYLQIIIYSTVSTTFARVVGITELHNRVEAVALLQEEDWQGIFGQNALVVLKPTSSNCNGDFLYGASAQVTLDGGGVLVNSDNDVCAFECNGSSTSGEFNIINGGTFSVVGDPGYRLDGCTTAINPSDIHSGAEPVEFPPDLVLPEPPECSMTPATPTEVDSTTVILHPGLYDYIPPQGMHYDKFIMDPGNYCVSKVYKDPGNTSVLTGTDVFIYVQNGGDFKINGGAVQIDAPSDMSNPYNGFLIYVEPGPENLDGTAYVEAPSVCSISGNGGHTFTGAIYAPNCSVTLNGGSWPAGIRAQIISYELKINGDAVLNIIYSEEDMPQEYVPPATGIAH